MKEVRKRRESEDVFEVVGKRPRTPEAEDQDEEELLLAGFSVKEETLMQVMKVLEEEISCSANPSSSVMFSPSSSFVTINGNEESCGPSFSDSASTVMASIDMGGISISYFMSSTNVDGPLDLPAAAKEEEHGFPEIGKFSVSGVSGVGINGSSCEFEVGESEDEWLARVLNGSPLEFEE
ncbi:hypothetical protein NE237_026287 [Protea cynaroides]|uniref:Uncharacterized protein n=1 Tax=Protea cynaroides TaxID=273540 RepID=A0A9Q0K114_9MAGN|nr:hypothetical protein NE237_026287 [Protea cynaroides]